MVKAFNGISHQRSTTSYSNTLWDYLGLSIESVINIYILSTIDHTVFSLVYLKLYLSREIEFKNPLWWYLYQQPTKAHIFPTSYKLMVK